MRPALLLVALLLAGCMGGGGSGSPGVVDASPAFDLGTALVSGLDDPVFLTHAGDGSGRLFVVEQRGLVRVVRDGRLLEEPFLDIAAGGANAKVLAGGERGLLGLAFHPDFEDNGRFYVQYTGAGGDLTIAQYGSEPGADVADAGSGRVLLVEEHSQFANHNGGMLAFGPDGHLYAAFGDGGSAGDPANNAQDLGNLLGKLIRLDVDGVCLDASLTPRPYCVPKDNPFVGREGRDEIWAYGLRNPWRFSFDRGTGDLWVADVGQNMWEEVDRAPVGTGGQNYGWSRHEGTRLHRQDRVALDAVDPVAEYAHDEAGASHCSVTGGYVYRGAAIPDLVGVYLFADYCSGFIWTLTGSGATWSKARTHDTDLNVSSFGEDEDGELYVVDHGGQVHKLVAR